MTEEDDNLSPATNYSEITPQYHIKSFHRFIQHFVWLCVFEEKHIFKHAFTDSLLK